MEKRKLNFSCSALFHMKTTASLKYFVNDCRCKYFFAFNSPETPANLISLTISKTVRPFAQFEPKIRSIKIKECTKFFLTW